MNTDEYWDNSKRGICQNVLLPLYPQCVLLNLYFYRQFLVSAASDKRWFLFGKVTKTCQTFFFFLNTQPSGCIWRQFDFLLTFIDLSWNLHTKRNCFQRLARNIVIFMFFPLQTPGARAGVESVHQGSYCQSKSRLIWLRLVCCSSACCLHAWTAMKTNNK